ncbi:PEP/pyruvate-binding domain-containing protein [Roseibium sp.]|uniref:PEP/pyruvate-binding domain-containing protein n=1 Tax=Roseibium sp. TaxID=1936156 RepID=UPI003A9869D7
MAGGKNAPLGDTVNTLDPEGIRVPDGFATTPTPYWQFLETNDLKPEIERALEDLNEESATLAETGSRNRKAFLRA